MGCATAAPAIAEHVISSAQASELLMRSFPYCCCLVESGACRWAGIAPIADRSD